MSIPANQRQSQWIVFERCLALLRRLMRGTAKTDELLRIVEQHADDDQSTTASSVEKRFEKDRERLKEFFGVQLRYDRSERAYRLLAMDCALIDLSPEAVRGLAFLQATFADETTPMQRQINTLIQTLTMALSTERRREIERERGLIELDLRKRDSDTIDDAIWDKVGQAVREHRELEFEYYSPQQEDEKPRTHCVESQRLFFDRMRAHYYVEAYCIEHRGPKGNFPDGTMHRYRLGRISNPVLLPRKFVPGVHVPRKHDLIYELSPKVARYGITEHFSGSEVDYRSDGSAVVRAKSTDLFWDIRALLHYGANFRILGGEEALKEIKEIVVAMHKQYWGG